jgi:Centromere protein H (CENP-H)
VRGRRQVRKVVEELIGSRLDVEVKLAPPGALQQVVVWVHATLGVLNNNTRRLEVSSSPGRAQDVSQIRPTVTNTAVRRDERTMDSRDTDVERLLQTPASNAFTLSEKESQVLQLWNQLQELDLEKAVLEAQSNRPSNPEEDPSQLSPERLQAALSEAESGLLSSRSAHSLRQKIITNTLIADPVLKSAHESHAASPLEQRLLPLLHERDILSLTLSHLSNDLSTSQSQLYALESKLRDTNEGNRVLVKEMLRLAEATKSEVKIEDVADETVRERLEELEREVSKARRKYRVMRGLVRGVVVGSGIDWVRSDGGRWRAVVLDNENDAG